jgi:hypothetical protein
MIGYIQGTFRDGSGRIVVGGTITVIIHGTSTVATTYSDDACTIPYTAITSGTDGSFLFYVNDSGILTYDLYLTATGYAQKAYLGVYPLGRYTGEVYDGALTNITGRIWGNGNVIHGSAIASSALDVTIDATYNNKTLNMTNTAATKTITFPAPSATYSDFRIDIIRTGTKQVTVTLPASTYWWGDSKCFQSFYLMGHVTVWCDGTNWYVTPLYITVSSTGTPSVPIIVASNYSTQYSSYYAQDLSTWVPACGKGIKGALSQGTTSKYLYLAGKSDGTYEIGRAYGATGGGTSSFSGDLLEPQKVYISTTETSAFNNNFALQGFYV